MLRLVRRCVVTFGLMVGLLAGSLGSGGTALAAALPTIHGSWKHVPAFPANVAPLTVTSGADGRIYLFGFCDGHCPQVGGTVGLDHNVTEIYNPATRTWKAGRGAPAACDDAQASVGDAGGLIDLGGCFSKAAAHQLRIASYDPTTANWSIEPGHGPYASPLGGMLGPNGRIYWFSQVLQDQGGGTFVTGYQVITQDESFFFDGTPVPNEAPSDASALGADGRVYTLGGTHCFPEFGTCAVPPVQAYRAATNNWAQVTRLPTPRIDLSAVADADGRIFTMGGLSPDASRSYRTVQVYRARSQTWLRAQDLPLARIQALATATADGRVWLIGGYDANGQPLTDGEMFSPRAKG